MHRYNSSVNTTSCIRYGEISYRVSDLQKYINWYFGKDVVTVDGIFGDATFDYVKQMQNSLGVSVDGIVGGDTLKAMAEVQK